MTLTHFFFFLVAARQDRLRMGKRARVARRYRRSVWFGVVWFGLVWLEMCARRNRRSWEYWEWAQARLANERIEEKIKQELFLFQRWGVSKIRVLFSVDSAVIAYCHERAPDFGTTVLLTKKIDQRHVVVCSFLTTPWTGIRRCKKITTTIATTAANNWSKKISRAVLCAWQDCGSDACMAVRVHYYQKMKKDSVMSDFFSSPPFPLLRTAPPWNEQKKKVLKKNVI